MPRRLAARLFLPGGGSSGRSSSSSSADNNSQQQQQLSNNESVMDKGQQHGLENFGNTCYANAVLQALYSCRPFRDRIFTAGTHNLAAMMEVMLSLQERSKSDESIEEIAVESSAAASAAVNDPATTSASSLLAPPNAATVKRSPSANTVISPSPADDKSILKPTSDHSILRSLKDLFVSIHNHHQTRRTKVVSPKAFLQHVRQENEMFSEPIQHDAHEFLNYLLNDIAETLLKQQRHLGKLYNYKNDDEMESKALSTWIHDLFQGQLANNIKCLNCETVTNRIEPFLDLSLDIPSDHCSLTHCLRNFSVPELLNDRNKFFCDECNDYHEAEKRMKIRKPPRILALHLKRFKFIERLQRHIKLLHRVSFPTELYLPPECLDDPADASDAAEYRLFAAVIHIGSTPSRGHYVSIAKSHGQWWLFDDESVDPMDAAFLPTYFGTGSPGDAGNQTTGSLTPPQKPSTPTSTPAKDEQTGVDPSRAHHDSILAQLGGGGYGLMPGEPQSRQRFEEFAKRRKDGCGYILFYESISSSTNSSSLASINT